MASFETSDFRKGLKILYNDVPWIIVDFQHVKPGKGNQFTRTRIKNLLMGNVIEVTLRSGESVGDPEIEDRTMSFLYNDGDVFHFMDEKTFDQVELQRDSLGGTDKFLLPEMKVGIMFWKGRAISVDMAAQVELKITETEPGVRGDTATNVTKAATLETGAVVQVPLFINVGDTVKVDTRTGEYLERKAIG